MLSGGTQRRTPLLRVEIEPSRVYSRLRFYLDFNAFISFFRQLPIK